MPDKCTRIKLDGGRCGRYPIKGGTVCMSHGGAAGHVRRAADRRLAEAKAASEVARQGVVVLPGQSPLDVLEDALADIVRLKSRLGAVVDRLADESLRYPGRAGEQLRGELSAYQAALRDTVKAAETMLKLGIAERRIKIEEAQAVLLVACIAAVLDDIGLTAEQRALADVAVPVRMLEASGNAEPADAVAAYTGPRHSPVRR